MRKVPLRLAGLAAFVGLAFAVGASLLFGAEDSRLPSVREGDILFQPSVSGQSLAIQIATGSRYSHCGILVEKDGRPYVFEAIRTVGFTPLEDWIKRGVAGHYVLMRLKDPSVLTPDVLAAMRHSGAPFAGRKYDILFQWSDEALYCSELVWKIYERGAGIELVPLRVVGDYDLKNTIVRKHIRERFGDTLQLDEKAVAPADIMQSPLLEVVGGN